MIKTALITGGTSGLGFESARALAQAGYTVLLTGRSLAVAEQACAKVGPQCTPLELELESPASIVACAERAAALAPAIDVLMCNAGIMVQGKRRVVNGIEQHFAVNHLAHFLLVDRLRPNVLAAPQGRVVMVASSAYKWAPPAGIEFDNLDGARGFTPNRAYGQSKLANALFSLRLSREFAGTRATSNSLNPGPSDTALWRHFPWWQRALLAPFKKKLLKSAEEAAKTQIHVAMAPELAQVSGKYFEQCLEKEPPPQVRDERLADELWRVSSELLRPYLRGSIQA